MRIKQKERKKRVEKVEVKQAMDQPKKKLIKECLGKKQLMVGLSRLILGPTKQQANSEKLDVVSGNFGCCWFLGFFFGMIVDYSGLCFMIVIEQLSSVDTKVPLKCVDRHLDGEERKHVDREKLDMVSGI